MKKKCLIALLGITLAITFVGCSKDRTDSTVAQNSAPQTFGAGASEESVDTSDENVTIDESTISSEAESVSETKDLSDEAIAQMSSDERFEYIKEQLGEPGDVVVPFYDGDSNNMDEAVKVLNLHIPKNIYGDLTYWDSNVEYVGYATLEVEDREDKYVSLGSDYVKLTKDDVVDGLAYYNYYGQNKFGKDSARNGEVQFSVKVNPMNRSTGWFLHYTPLEDTGDGVVGYDYGSKGLSVYYFINGCEVYLNLDTYNTGWVDSENAERIVELLRSYVEFEPEVRHVEPNIPDYAQ